MAGTGKIMTPADLLTMLPHKLYARIATLLAAIAAFGWIGVSLTVAIAHPQDPVIREPIETTRILLLSVGLTPPPWLATTGEWLDHHQALGAVSAAIGGAAANGSALQRGPLRQGGGAVICWASLIVAAESLGPVPALGWALAGAMPFLGMAMIWAALADLPGKTLPSPFHGPILATICSRMSSTW